MNDMSDESVRGADLKIFIAAASWLSLRGGVSDTRMNIKARQCIEEGSSVNVTTRKFYQSNCTMGSSRNLRDFGFLSISQDEYADSVKMESLKFRPLRVQAQNPKRKVERPKGTTNAALILNIVELDDDVVKRIAYLVYIHDIPEDLVINTDETGLQLFPACQDRTFAVQGSQNVTITGAGDKRHVTVLVSSSARGFVLPMQVIFEGKSDRSCPKGPEARNLRVNGFHLTFSPSHWTTVHTFRDFVEFVLVPWLKATCESLHRNPDTQKMVWLVDVYSIHISKEFRDWLALKYPNICLLFVPANCTSKLQPADVILMRPFKCGIQRQWEMAVDEITGQMQNGISPETATLPNQVGPLRNLLCGWLYQAYNELCQMHPMIRRGWMKIGFQQAWTTQFQVAAVEMNAAGLLFKTSIEQEPTKESETTGFDGL
ncbi:hypothetical protein R1sor_019256 [Riccia sorocarpa]|uniref:DDE-1 domain-containing protein n=1 Tax=Riccia sorocarpa TaxID=122646 RepID=A0ABD3IFB6_9MARC